MIEDAHQSVIRQILISNDRVEPITKSTIRTIGIPTCNRREALHRCAASFLDNCRVYDRHPRLLVTDDSVAPTAQAENTACLKELRQLYPEFDFVYAGLPEKHYYCDALALYGGVDPAVLEFALFNSENLAKIACGPNRNALFLATVGECFLSVDDDVVCRPVKRNGISSTIEVSSRNDPTLVNLFCDRSTLLLHNPSSTVDLLGLHENLLGKSLGALLRSQPEIPIALGQLSRASFDRLRGGASRIRVSWNGIYGDSGARYPNHYLWKDESTFGQLTAGEESYRKLALSRQIFRAPGSLTVGTSGYCQSTALAYDHRASLPPYMPLRGLDFVFGQTLVTCLSGSLIAYHPWALLHDPLEERRNSEEDLRHGGETISYFEILQVLIAIYARDETPKSLTALGQHLCAIGALSAREFEEILQIGLWKKITRRIERFDRKLSDNPRAPHFWAEDVRVQIRVRQAQLTPAGLRNSILADESTFTVQERLMLVQRLTMRFGQLLQAWPAVIEAALELKSKEICLGRSLS